MPVVMASQVAVTASVAQAAPSVPEAPWWGARVEAAAFGVLSQDAFRLDEEASDVGPVLVRGTMTVSDPADLGRHRLGLGEAFGRVGAVREQTAAVPCPSSVAG